MPKNTEMVLITYDEIIRGDCCTEGTATLFKIDKDERWIPNSLIEDWWDHDNQIQVPLWFAKKEGLV